MTTIQLEMTDGTCISADLSYGKMTDTVTVDTTIGTFVFKGSSVRVLFNILYNLGVHNRNETKSQEGN